MKNKKSFSTKHKLTLIPLMLAAALLASCENLISRTPHESIGGGYEQGVNSGNESGLITVTARVSNGAARSAMPSIPDFAYAALFYQDDNPPESPQSEDFAKGEAAGEGKLVFSFQRPDETSGFTLEIFAFKAGTTDFSRGSEVLSGKKEGLSVAGDAIEVNSITLSMNESFTEPGTVELKIKVPDGCSLEIDDTANFKCEGPSPNFTVTQKNASGIEKGLYPLTFTVSGSVACTLSECINVFPGMCTDTWDGLAKNAPKEITKESLSKTVYVRGTGGWYENSPTYNSTAAASDTNSGSLLFPFASIQKAVDAVIERNDGASAYTIYVDGELKGTTATKLGASGMADFTALDKNLNLTIKGMSANATLDGGARFDGNGTPTAEGIGKGVIFAKSKPDTAGKLNLTIEKLTIKGGKKTGNGGGVYLNSPGGSLTIGDGTTISGNMGGFGGGVSINSGAFTMSGGTISDNWSTGNSGGVDVGSGGASFMMTGGTISGNKAINGGGVLVASGGTFTMSNGKISGNTAQYGGGVYNRCAFTMTGGTIEKNNADDGGGVYVTEQDGVSATFTMQGGTVGGATDTGKNTAQYGGGVYVNAGTFKMGGSANVSGNKALGKTQDDDTLDGGGGGVYVASGAFTMSGGTVSGNTVAGDTDYSGGGGLYVFENGTFTMTGGAISKNVSNKNGGGIFVNGGMLGMTNGTVGGETSSEGNSSTGHGGGMYVTNSATVTLTNCSIKYCKTTSTSGGGGGIYTGGNATIKIEGGEISKCSARSGGGVYEFGGTLEISNCKINGNTASSNGGGAYCFGTMTITGSTLFSGNTASKGKGAYLGGTINTLKMSDAAKFESYNDIYANVFVLQTYSKIQIIGSLTAESPVATITFDSYGINTKVLSKTDDVPDSLDDICQKFAVTPYDGTEYELRPSGSGDYGLLKAK